MTDPKAAFEAALAAAGIPSFQEPRREVDGNIAYDCFDNSDGDEIAFISYREGEIMGYTVR